jgi:glycosyltransferase involved in cell wall biosynthesis
MSFLDEVTVLILTHNEEANIGRTLKALGAFPTIKVLDSGSTDETIAIVEQFKNASVSHEVFNSHASQWNRGLIECRSPWVLALDADYILPELLVDTIAALAPPAHIAGYRVAFRYCVLGRPLSGSLYPPVVVIFRRAYARYRQFGHTQRLEVDGEISVLPGQIDHDDRKPTSRWFAAQARYAVLEADYLLAKPSSELRWVDRVRLTGWLGPFLVLFYTSAIKGCVLNGRAGWLYVLQRVVAEIMLCIEIMDRKLRDV